MQDGQSAFAEPMTMQEALAKADSLTVAKEAKQEEPAQEPEEESEITDDTVAPVEDEAETDEPDEPESGDEGSDQVLTADEYGDVLVDVGGTPTPLRDVLQGNLRLADYSRKMNAFKEERDAASAELAERAQELDAREQQLAELAAELDEQEPDWVAMAEEDPLGVTLEQAKWQKKQKAKAERQKQRKAREDARKEEFRQLTIEKALEVFPEWQQENAFKSGIERRRNVALEAGFSKEEYENHPDFRFAVLLELAARGKDTLSKVDTKRVRAEKKIANAPKVLKPGQGRGDTDAAQDRRAAFQKRLSKPTSSAEIAKWIGRR